MQFNQIYIGWTNKDNKDIYYDLHDTYKSKEKSI